MLQNFKRKSVGHQYEFYKSKARPKCSKLCVIKTARKKQKQNKNLDIRLFLHQLRAIVEYQNHQLYKEVESMIPYLFRSEMLDNFPKVFFIVTKTRQQREL